MYLMSKLVINLTTDMVEEINRIGRERMPNEACGVILPIPKTAEGGTKSQVVELPNRSLLPGTFKLEVADLTISLQEFIDEGNRWVIDNLAIWHTHPEGNIGPSPADMKKRLLELPYLVVALLPDGSAVPSWF